MLLWMPHLWWLHTWYLGFSNWFSVHFLGTHDENRTLFDDTNICSSTRPKNQTPDSWKDQNNEILTWLVYKFQHIFIFVLPWLNNTPTYTIGESWFLMIYGYKANINISWTLWISCSSCSRKRRHTKWHIRRGIVSPTSPKTLCFLSLFSQSSRE